MTDTTIESADWTHINEAVASIYSASPMPDLVDVTRRLHKLIDFSHSITCLIGEKSDGIEFFEYRSAEMDEKSLSSYRNKYIYHDFILWYCASPAELAFRESDIINEPYFSNSILMREWLEPMGVHYGAGINIAGNGRSYGNICIYRSKEEGDFSEHDLLVLRTINTHLCICFRNLFPNGLKRSSLGGDEWQFATRYQLTEREAQIARLAESGVGRGDLATQTILSENTIKKHLNSIFKKTGTSSYSELVHLVSTSGSTLTRRQLRQGLADAHP